MLFIPSWHACLGLGQALSGCVPLGSEIKVGVILIGVSSTDRGDGLLRIDSVRVVGLGLLHYAVRARDSIPTFKTSTGTGRVVAYPLVGAVDLAEVADFPSVPAVSGIHFVTIRFNDGGPGIIG